ncbi:DUF4440 domain-containing protein [Sphingobium baderi]|uniref:SnoaL-like domain-containing protein n=1 Tax=Sphingobium baderi TaxID=1332080 RepID=A0A0S3EY98_9SPHN|nr:DUF4440 domain-containing protein [Sphingobium baderi]ALR20400.1 hypothetical protein ATN00_08850 [Sphingobium baderi]
MSNIDMVHKFMDAVTARDLDAYRALCEPTYTLWHSYNQVDMDIETSVRALQMMIRVMPEIEYIDRDIFEAPRGSVIAQYICRGSTILGEAVALHVMLRIFFSERGLVQRIEEYVDSGECMVIRRAGEAQAA